MRRWRKSPSTRRIHRSGGCATARRRSGTCHSADGQVNEVEPGKSVTLSPSLRIQFGSREGEVALLAMHQHPRRVLRKLLADNGPTLLNDPSRVDALLADLSESYHKERFSPGPRAARGVSRPSYWPNRRVGQSTGSGSHSACRKRYGFSVEAANWAIESWALVLDIAPLNPNTLRDGSQNGAVRLPSAHFAQIALRLRPDFCSMTPAARGCPSGRPLRAISQRTLSSRPRSAGAYSYRTVITSRAAETLFLQNL